MIINQIVSGGGTLPDFYIEKNVSNGVVGSTKGKVDLSGITEIAGSFCFAGLYYQDLQLTGAAFDNYNNLTAISGYYTFYNTFYGCENLTATCLDNVTTISGTNLMEGAFRYCYALTSTGLGNLKTLSSSLNQTFGTCRGLITTGFEKLETISVNNSLSSCFSGCSNLVDARFTKLSVIDGNLANSATGAVFGYCEKLENVYFNAVKSTTFSSYVTQFRYLFNSATGSTAPNGCTVHFPSNFDPSDPDHTFDASTLTGYPTFGGNASYIHVAFDLPATE